MKPAVTALRGGLLVRTDAIVLALDLETRGHVLTAQDGALLVSGGSTLTAADRTAVQELKRHLLAVAGYEAPALS